MVLQPGDFIVCCHEDERESNSIISKSERAVFNGRELFEGKDKYPVVSGSND